MEKTGTSIKLTSRITEKADELVKSGQFENRSHAIRKTLSDAWGLNKQPEPDNAPSHTHSTE